MRGLANRMIPWEFQAIRAAIQVWPNLWHAFILVRGIAARVLQWVLPLQGREVLPHLPVGSDKLPDGGIGLRQLLLHVLHGDGSQSLLFHSALDAFSHHRYGVGAHRVLPHFCDVLRVLRSPSLQVFGVQPASSP